MTFFLLLFVDQVQALHIRVKSICNIFALLGEDAHSNQHIESIVDSSFDVILLFFLRGKLSTSSNSA